MGDAPPVEPEPRKSPARQPPAAQDLPKEEVKPKPADTQNKNPSQTEVPRQPDVEHPEGLEQQKEAMLKAFEAFQQDIHKKKRKLEEDLEAEIETKRKRMQEQLNQEFEDRKSLQEQQLSTLQATLSDCTMMIAEENTLLEELRQKRMDMAQEQAQQEQARAANLKEALKEKLKQRVEAGATPQAATTTAAPGVPVNEDRPAPHQPEPNKMALATNMRFTSSTHPNEWAFLYRLCRQEGNCEKEIYDAWHAGTA